MNHAIRHAESAVLPDDPEARTPLADHLTAADVVDLVQARAWPSVSLLMPTSPAARMTAEDADRLAQLLGKVEAELAELHAADVRLVARLRAAASDATRGPTGRGLALFVSQAVSRTFRLPTPVAVRAVVEPTFATRDLVQTLHRTPPHLILLLTPLCAQLYRGQADTLVPISGWGFPIQRELAAVGALVDGDDRLDEFAQRVDEALEPARDQHPAPIILAGPAAQVAAMLRRGRNLHRLAGVLPESATRTPAGLHEAAQLSLEEYLLSREEEALILLDEALADHDVTVEKGIERCWNGANQRRPRMLVVEEGFRCPAVVDGRQVRRIDAMSSRLAVAGDVRHDLVDDLIEVVIGRGGWVAFTRNGALGPLHRVALVTEPHS